MGTTLCSAVATAYLPSAALGNYGSNWVGFLKDPTNGRYHLMANNGVAGIVYLNSSTTDAIGSWNTAGTIETIAVASPSVGGAALASGQRSIYGSYGVNATSYDLRLSQVIDYTVASNVIAAPTRLNPDLSGMLQLAPAAGAQLKNLSSASTRGGRPAMVYVDFSSGTAITGKLKYAYRSGPSATGQMGDKPHSWHGQSRSSRASRLTTPTIRGSVTTTRARLDFFSLRTRLPTVRVPGRTTSSRRPRRVRRSPLPLRIKRPY